MSAKAFRPLTLLLYHKSGDLSRGFEKVFQKFLVDYCSARFLPQRSICAILVGCFPSPLDTIIIPQEYPKVNSQIAQRYRYFTKSFCVK